MANCYLSETGHNKVELVFNILTYSDVIRHIKDLSRNIQTHSKGYVTPVYSETLNIQKPGIFTTLAHSVSCHIQKPGIFRTLVYSEHWLIQKPGIFRSLAYSEP